MCNFMLQYSFTAQRVVFIHVVVVGCFQFEAHFAGKQQYGCVNYVHKHTHTHILHGDKFVFAPDIASNNVAIKHVFFRGESAVVI